MGSTKADILLHPVRLRIVLALSAERGLTTAQIAARLPEIAHATLYRHVAMLAEAGLIEAVEERRVRGGVERTYALVTEAAQLGPDDVADMTPEEQSRGFAVFVGSLVEAFSRYVGDPGARPDTDLVGYRQIPLWLDQHEQTELLERLRVALGPFLDNESGEGRARVLLSTIIFPDPG